MKITSNHFKALFYTFTSASDMIRRIKRLGSKKNDLILWADLVYWRMMGYDFDDYLSFRFWEKDSKERKQYLSFRENTRWALNVTPGNVVDLFLDKSEWNSRFHKYVKRSWTTTNGLDRQSILDFIRSNESVILKPLSDYGGVGIRKVTADDPDLEESLEYILAQKDLMMEKCMENHPDLKRLAPSSLNTIRIVTVVDRKGKVHIPAALLCMGSGTSVTDNYHTGGMACPIDITTGRLTKKATGEFNTHYERHPFTGIKFENYLIPRFREVLEMAERIALEIPEARYVGWDFVVTPEAIEVLEGNIPPGEHITQLSAGPIRERLAEWL